VSGSNIKIKKQKLKKANSIKDVDSLLKEAVETGLKPRFSQLTD